MSQYVKRCAINNERIINKASNIQWVILKKQTKQSNVGSANLRLCNRRCHTTK